MKKVMSACFFFFFSVMAFAQKVVNDPNAEVRQVRSFHGISVSNAFQVIVTQGNEEGVVVSAGNREDNQYIRTEVENGILKIWFDNKLKKDWGRNRKLKAYVAVKNLTVLRASGATNIDIEGQLTTKNLRIDLSGASDVSGNIVVADDLSVEISGASDIEISGSAKDVSIEASGASEFEAYEFRASTCRIEASGACSITISVDKELSADLSGASSVSYKGNATVKTIKTSGASSVSKKS